MSGVNKTMIWEIHSSLWKVSSPSGVFCYAVYPENHAKYHLDIQVTADKPLLTAAQTFYIQLTFVQFVWRIWGGHLTARGLWLNEKPGVFMPFSNYMAWLDQVKTDYTEAMIYG